MRLLIKILKGLLIGISVVIPGVSGGSMAVSMGIYDQLIDFFTASRGSRKRGFSLLPYGIGLLLGIAIFSYFIELMFAAFPLQTAFLFVGLILGAVPMLFKQVRGERFRWSHAVLLLSTAALMVLLPIASGNTETALKLLPEPLYALLALGLGVIAAATMVVPGVSGSMLLILLGYYEPVLHYVNSFTSALLRLQLDVMLQSLIILAPFALGALLGIIVMSRAIRGLLKRFPFATYYAIIGLVIASPFTVLYQQTFTGGSVPGYIACALLMAAGFFAAVLLGKGES